MAIPEAVWPDCVEAGGGGTFRVRGRSYSFGVKRLLSRGEYEKEERKLVEDWIRDGMAVFELGASIGFISTCLAEKVGPNGRVVSVEASNRLAVELKGWIESKYPWVTVLSGIAIPVLDGRSIRLNGFIDNGTSLGGRAEILETSDPEPRDETRDENGGMAGDLLDLETIIEKTGVHPTALVIDIEGSEVVFSNPENRIPESVEIIIIELHPYLYSSGDRTKNDIIRSLVARGFELKSEISEVYCFTRASSGQDP